MDRLKPLSKLFTSLALPGSPVNFTETKNDPFIESQAINVSLDPRKLPELGFKGFGMDIASFSVGKITLIATRDNSHPVEVLLRNTIITLSKVGVRGEEGKKPAWSERTGVVVGKVETKFQDLRIKMKKEGTELPHDLLFYTERAIVPEQTFLQMFVSPVTVEAPLTFFFDLPSGFVLAFALSDILLRPLIFSKGSELDYFISRVQVSSRLSASVSQASLRCSNAVSPSLYEIFCLLFRPSSLGPSAKHTYQDQKWISMEDLVRLAPFKSNGSRKERKPNENFASDPLLSLRSGPLPLAFVFSADTVVCNGPLSNLLPSLPSVSLPVGLKKELEILVNKTLFVFDQRPGLSEYSTGDFSVRTKEDQTIFSSDRFRGNADGSVSLYNTLFDLSPFHPEDIAFFVSSFIHSQLISLPPSLSSFSSPSSSSSSSSLSSEGKGLSSSLSSSIEEADHEQLWIHLFQLKTKLPLKGDNFITIDHAGEFSITLSTFIRMSFADILVSFHHDKYSQPQEIASFSPSNGNESCVEFFYNSLISRSPTDLSFPKKPDEINTEDTLDKLVEEYGSKLDLIITTSIDTLHTFNLDLLSHFSNSFRSLVSSSLALLFNKQDLCSGFVFKANKLLIENETSLSRIRLIHLSHPSRTVKTVTIFGVEELTSSPTIELSDRGLFQVCQNLKITSGPLETKMAFLSAIHLVPLFGEASLSVSVSGLHLLSINQTVVDQFSTDSSAHREDQAHLTNTFLDSEANLASKFITSLVSFYDRSLDTSSCIEIKDSLIESFDKQVHSLSFVDSLSLSFKQKVSDDPEEDTERIKEQEDHQKNKIDLVTCNVEKLNSFFFWREPHEYHDESRSIKSHLPCFSSSSSSSSSSFLHSPLSSDQSMTFETSPFAWISVPSGTTQIRLSKLDELLIDRHLGPLSSHAQLSSLKIFLDTHQLSHTIDLVDRLFDHPQTASINSHSNQHSLIPKKKTLAQEPLHERFVYLYNLMRSVWGVQADSMIRKEHLQMVLDANDKDLIACQLLPEWVPLIKSWARDYLSKLDPVEEEMSLSADDDAPPFIFPPDLPFEKREELVVMLALEKEMNNDPLWDLKTPNITPDLVKEAIVLYRKKTTTPASIRVFFKAPDWKFLEAAKQLFPEDKISTAFRVRNENSRDYVPLPGPSPFSPVSMFFDSYRSSSSSSSSGLGLEVKENYISSLRPQIKSTLSRDLTEKKELEQEERIREMKVVLQKAEIILIDWKLPRGTETPSTYYGSSNTNNLFTRPSDVSIPVLTDTDSLPISIRLLAHEIVLDLKQLSPIVPSDSFAHQAVSEKDSRRGISQPLFSISLIANRDLFVFEEVSWRKSFSQWLFTLSKQLSSSASSSIFSYVSAPTAESIKAEEEEKEKIKASKCPLKKEPIELVSIRRKSDGSPSNSKVFSLFMRSFISSKDPTKESFEILLNVLPMKIQVHTWLASYLTGNQELSEFYQELLCRRRPDNLRNEEKNRLRLDQLSCSSLLLEASHGKLPDALKTKEGEEGLLSYAKAITDYNSFNRWISRVPALFSRDSKAIDLRDLLADLLPSRYLDPALSSFLQPPSSSSYLGHFSSYLDFTSLPSLPPSLSNLSSLVITPSTSSSSSSSQKRNEGYDFELEDQEKDKGEGELKLREQEENNDQDDLKQEQEQQQENEENLFGDQETTLSDLKETNVPLGSVAHLVLDIQRLFVQRFLRLTLPFDL